MEDGVKEDPAQCKEPKFLGKAGWVKKAPGRLLASYKDRYIHVEKTEIVVYENEDLQNCLERLDLENYEKCHELKSPFKKKNRLILIRSPKSGNKVHDVKFQAQTAEEKEAWIKALSDGINRAKNKVFDEVKVDESSNLEHVTRTRPKGNRNRRPPTRIHMKEVAVVSSDGILRLDLDLEDALMPNGTHHSSVHGSETPKEAIKLPTPLSSASEGAEKQSGPSVEEEAQTEPEVSPQKKVIKPPMPPTKEPKPSSASEDEPNKDDGPEKKVLKPPMPPSKEAKPSVSPVVEATEEAKAEKMSEKSPDARKKTGPPPTPPNKPSSSSSMSNLVEASQSKTNSHPPTPPSKEKKPSHPSVEPDQEVQGTTDENKEKGEDNKEEVTGTAVETDEADQSISKEAVPSVRDDEPEGPSAEGQVSEEESGETISSGINKASDCDPQTPTQPVRKSPSPLLTPKKKPEKPVQPDMQHIEDNTTITQPNEGQDPTALLQTASDTSASSPQAEEALPKSEVPSVVVSLNDPATDSLSLSPLLCHLPGEKKKKAEEKSVDSGQHSDDDSEGSGSEDTVAASTAALRGSHAGLDMLDASEDDIHVSVSLRPTEAATKPQVKSKVFPCQRSEPTPPLKPSTKARSASIGDLLSDSSVCIQVRQHTRAVAGSDRASSDEVMKLEAEVALEIEKTSELLSRVSQSQKGSDGEGMPEDLLAKAMEKLKSADRVLREVKKLKPAKNSSNRKSW
ncbi:hyphal wall protein 1 [Siniperca chuatsi]|uniref:hyphal wall protein 1 n=1 Tax=Siniperca chuatsi TaxID=119488 RepID=UPI001CE15A23|nr:hyphal wall protein 1 [Siniperca chuatsi]XP_044054196.1 hyphal wall protein 1 [Siniperca chuatsi]